MKHAYTTVLSPLLKSELYITGLQDQLGIGRWMKAAGPITAPLTLFLIRQEMEITATPALTQPAQRVEPLENLVRLGISMMSTTRLKLLTVAVLLSRHPSH